MPSKLKCKRCGGSGIEIDQAKTGREMRARRLDFNLTLKAVAKLMGISDFMLSMMERGKRAWNGPRIESCKEAIRKLSK